MPVWRKIVEVIRSQFKIAGKTNIHTSIQTDIIGNAKDQLWVAAELMSVSSSGNIWKGHCGIQLSPIDHARSDVATAKNKIPEKNPKFNGPKHLPLARV